MSAHAASDDSRASAWRLGSAFWTLWSANAVTNTADGVLRILIPLLAVQLTTHPGLIATATVLVTLPWAVAALPVGLLADRRNRKFLLVAANAGRGVVLLVLALSAVTGWLSLPVLYVVAFAVGVCEVTADLTSGTLIPMVVPRTQLGPANAWVNGAQTVLDEFVGPPLGGLLVALGVATAAGSTTAAYAAAALALVLLLRGNYRPVRTEPSGLRSDLVEGLRFIWFNPLRRALTLMIAVMAGCWSGWLAVLVIYALGPMQLSEFSYGVLLSMLAVGGVLGSVIAAPIERRVGRRTVMGLDIATGIIMLGTPALTANVYLVGLATLAGGLGSGMWNVTVLTLTQLITPEAIRGRASSVTRTAAWGSMPLGAALAGVVATAIDVQAVFLGAACLTALAVIPLLRTVTTTRIDEAVTAAREQDQTAPTL